MTKMLKTSPVDRKCAFPGCTHTLSIYNHEPYCHVHRDQIPRDQRHRLLSDSGVQAETMA
ncbi:MAG: hypothetical protein WC496_10965 [Phycisphaerae bacterium]